MTEKSWRLDRLGALADEWIAEREIFMSSMHAYLHSHLSNDDNKALQTLDIASYQHEIATIGERLCDFVRAMEGTAWYALRSPDRMAAFQSEMDVNFGTSSIADAERMAELEPPSDYPATHDALRRGIGLERHILQVLKESRSQFDFAVLRFTRRLIGTR